MLLILIMQRAVSQRAIMISSAFTICRVLQKWMMRCRLNVTLRSCQMIRLEVHNLSQTVIGMRQIIREIEAVRQSMEEKIKLL